MKKKRTSRRKRIEALALCAAMIFTFSADSIIRPYSVFAQEEESSEKEVEAEIKSDIMQIDYGSVEFWRWERVGKDNYPRDDEEHMSLFIFGNEDGDGDSKLFSSLAPRDLYIGPSASAIPGVSGSNVLSTADPNAYYSQFVSDGKPGWGDYIGEQYAHYIKLDSAYSAPYNYTKYGLDTSKNVFFTTADMNPVFVKYKGVSDHVDGVDGKDAPIYSIRIKSNNKTKYYWWATDKSSESLPQIATDDKKSNWTFRSSDNDDRGILYRPVVFDKGNDDEGMATKNTGYVVAFDQSDDGKDEDRCIWYIGEYKHFSALVGKTTVGSGQILSISENDYIGAGGDDEASQNGVIIPNGSKVIVEKGGILAIEGNVINNGTIENRGGTILIKKGGSIFPFQQGTKPTTNGCGTLKCVGGDIIIQEGGALYAGLFDTNGVACPFYLDESSVLINQGLLVYGNMRLGNGSRVELYENSRTYGSYGSGTGVSAANYSVNYSIPGSVVWKVTPKDGSGEVELGEWLYLNKHELEDEYNGYLAVNKGDEPDGYNGYLAVNKGDESTTIDKYVNDTLIPALAEKAKSRSSLDVEISKDMMYPSSTGYFSKDRAISAAETMGFSYLGETSDGTLEFSVYNMDANYNDLLSRNNSAFLSGTVTAVKFLRECQGLKGMYIFEDCVKTPTLLKVSSASLNDINKSSAIKVGELTL
ncbi:MAG: hypothetical protein K6F91_03200 [Ruminococcus sp.]|nr:hypothetical protein [Ruminococcus sp.]